MRNRMVEKHQEEPSRLKQHCYSLLADAILFTGDRIDDMSDQSMAGYLELASYAVLQGEPDFGKIRSSLIKLGFNTAPLN